MAKRENNREWGADRSGGDTRRSASPVASVRATCPTCGDVELTIGDMRALLCATTNETSYAFQCPECGMAVSKAAEASVVELLVSAGVALSVWEVPAEMEETHDGPPITYDDLLEFHFALQQPGWFERLIEAA